MAKILVVEDDTYIRDLYEEILKGEGYDVSVAIDGEDGVVKAREGGYDLVLLDVMMPKLNGLQVLQKLKEQAPQTPNKKIVLLTNLAQDPVVKEAMQTGASDFLLKADLNPGQLVEKVKGYLAV